MPSYDSQRGYEYARGMHRYAGNQMALGCLVFMGMVGVVTVALCAGLLYIVAEGTRIGEEQIREAERQGLIERPASP